MPVINGREWTKDQVKQAIREGRIAELWPDATYDDHGNGFGTIHFANGSQINYDHRPTAADQ